MDTILHKFGEIIIVLLLPAAFIGWGDDWDQIKKGAVTINSVEAQFVQKKHMEILTRPLVSRGMFYFRIPGSLRWEYTSPFHSILIMHDGAVTRYVKKGDAMVRDSSAGLQAMQIVLNDIARWTKGDFTANPGFSAELREGRTVILSPRNKSTADIIQRIVLRLADEPGVIRSVAIYESKKSYTLLEFSKVKLNAPVPDRLFTGP
jgi:outer membrane lipoprotein-sorting protein